MKNLKEVTCILLLGGIGSRYSNINEPPKNKLEVKNSPNNIICSFLNF